MATRRPRPNQQHSPDGTRYWERISERWSAEDCDLLWRRHSDHVNCALLREWLPEGFSDTVLKTDLFDEVHGEGLIPLLQSHGKHVIGIDIADTAIRRAFSGQTRRTAAKADVRSLPFKDDVFDVIVSTSTIDHFRTLEDFTLSIGEFKRVLKPGGRLILTVDNLSNPAVFIRNRMPFRIVNRLGLVPYYVGATCGPRRLKQIVIREGLSVQEVNAIEHTPRLLTVVLSRFVGRWCAPETQNTFLSALSSFELLNRLPTRFVSGYYIALLAVKPEAGDIA